MEELQIFSNAEFGEVRTLVLNNEPWFVGKDVAEVLGYSNPRDALSKHIDSEDKGVAKCDTLGGRHGDGQSDCGRKSKLKEVILSTN